MTAINPSAQAWLDFTRRLGEVGVAIHEKAAANRSVEQMPEINQCLLNILSATSLYQLRFDPDCPDWMPRLHSSFNMTAASPDNIYSTTRINGKGVFLFRGYRGTSERVHLSLDGGMMGYTPNNARGHVMKHYGAYDLDQFTIAEDGTFEIIASAERPEGHTGDWIALDPDEENLFLLMRQISHDPAREVDGWITMRRIDEPVRPGRLPKVIDQRLAELPEVIERMAQAVAITLDTQGFYEREINTLVDYTQKFGDVAVMPEQSYWGGRFSLTSDEAVVIEIRDLVGCAYWNAHLLDSFFGALEFMFTQSSLNKRTAHVDPDGVIRVVIAERDPGIANWLDKSDYPEVGIRLRFNKGTPPKLTARKVGFAELRESLHADTPVVGPTERAAQMAERIEGLQRRRRW